MWLHPYLQVAMNETILSHSSYFFQLVGSYPVFIGISLRFFIPICMGNSIFFASVNGEEGTSHSESSLNKFCYFVCKSVKRYLTIVSNDSKLISIFLFSQVPKLWTNTWKRKRWQSNTNVFCLIRFICNCVSSSHLVMSLLHSIEARYSISWEQ